MLDDVAPVDDPARALREDDARALEDLLVGDAAAAPDEDGDAGRGDDAVIGAQVIGGVGLDHVGAELGRLADEGDDAVGVAVDAVAAGARGHHERLDHERHAGAVGRSTQGGDVLDALAAQRVGPGDVEEVHADAGGVEAHRVADGVVDHVAEGVARRLLAVDVGHVDAQHEGGLLAAGDPLQQRRLADRELDGVGRGRPASRRRAPCPRCRAGSAARRRSRGRPRRRCSARSGRGRGDSGGRRRTRLDHRHGASRAAAWKDHAAVVIAGPNLTIDRTLAIDELRPGEVLRFERAVVTPGGKGVNVARVARDLGADAVLVGLLPGRTGVAGAALLGDEGIVVRGVEVGGELRSTAVVLERSGRVTVLNEPGPPLAPGEWELYEGVVADALRGERCWRAVGRCRRAPRPTRTRAWSASRTPRARSAIVDVGGEQLAAAVAAGADAVTPNLAEAEGLLHGRADETVDTGDVGVVRERAVAAARALVERGAARAVVTAAEAGAAVADGWLARWVAAPAVAEVRNPIGAGDALVGGLGAGARAGRGVRLCGGARDGLRGRERGDRRGGGRGPRAGRGAAGVG